MMNYLVHFTSGGVALSTSFAVMYPLDTYKLLIQSSNQPVLFRHLFRGFWSSIPFAIPQGGLRLATYELFKDKLPTFASVILADLASSVIKVPRELITAQCQVSKQSAWHVASDIVKKTGPLSLFRGFVSASARDWPFMIALFSTFERFQTLDPLSHFNQKHKHTETLTKSFYGGLSGSLAAFITTPIDNIRTRVMLNSKVDMLMALKQISSNGSIRPFFTGAMPRSIWWFSVSAIFFPLYETLQEQFRMTE